jgi:two-component system response regulator AtoC
LTQSSERREQKSNLKRELATDGPTLDGDVAEPPQGDVQLVVLEHGSLSSYSLPKRGSLKIGRAENSDIVLTDPAASRVHAVLHTGPTLELVDAGSHNGTRVGEQRLIPEQPVALQAGDAIRIGSALLLIQHAPSAVRQSSISGTRRSVSTSRPLIVAAPAMRAVFELVERVASSNINVLILGETGVGKEVVAESIHRASRQRSEGPFVRINCASLGESLFESELFGHQQGAFTGAVRSKVGLMQTADKGTLFLDEIGEVPLPIQAKLLRVIETREATPVGGVRPQPVDVRFLCATNRNLSAEVAKGTFREDLFFRLNGVTIPVPPLRERASEIPALAQLFLAAMAKELERPSLRLSAQTLEQLEQYRWPGNVRELRNAIECAALLANDSLIDVAHLPHSIREAARAAEAHSSAPTTAPPSLEAGGAVPLFPPDARRRLEYERIVRALEACHGNQTRAAEHLCMPRRTLVAKLSAYGIPRPRKFTPPPDT